MMTARRRVCFSFVGKAEVPGVPVPFFGGILEEKTMLKGIIFKRDSVLK